LVIKIGLLFKSILYNIGCELYNYVYMYIADTYLWALWGQLSQNLLFGPLPRKKSNKHHSSSYQFTTCI